MKFSTITLFTTTLFAFSAVAAPAVESNAVPEPLEEGVLHIFEDGSTLLKRGYGCNAIGSDDEGICNFHCVNDVTFKCANGKILRPYKGECGGFLGGVCQCVYNERC